MMKKLISLAIITVMAFSMVACSCSTATETNAPAPVAEGNTPAEAK